MKTLDFAAEALSILGVGVEGLCGLFFVLSGKVRKLPLVSSFVAYLFVSDAFLVLFVRRSDIWPMLEATSYIGYIFEAMALWELARLLLGSFGIGATVRKWQIISLFCIVGSFAAYLMTNMQSYIEYGSAEQRFLHIDLAVSIFRVLALIVIVFLLQFDDSEDHLLITRVTLVFAAYAVCVMLKDILDELVPRLGLPGETYEINDCVCGYVWVLLLFFLIWHIIHTLPPRSASSRSSIAANG